MKNISLVLAISMLLAGCVKAGPSEKEVMTVAQEKIRGTNEAFCILLHAPTALYGNLPNDKSIVLPSESTGLIRPERQRVLAAQLLVLEKAGYFATEPTTFVIPDKRAAPAVRYRLTQKGAAALNPLITVEPLCLNAGHLEPVDVEPLTVNQPEVEDGGPVFPARATRYVKVRWVDKPDWLSSPEGAMVFPQTPDEIAGTSDSRLKVELIQDSAGNWNKCKFGCSTALPHHRHPHQEQTGGADLVRNLQKTQP